MEQRVHKQIRAIRNFARANNMDLEQAAQEWCACGLAARWAELY